jgi:hypothetical protein
MLALQLLHISFSGQQIAVESFKNAHGRGPVEGANIGAGLVGPVDEKGHPT